MRSLIFFCAAIAVVAQDITIIQDAAVSQSENKFAARYASLVKLPEINAFGLGSFAAAMFTSFSAEASTNNSNTQVVGSSGADGMVTATMVLTGTNPGMFQGYFKAQSDWSAEMNKLEASLDVSGAASALAHSYFDIKEVSPQKEVVKTLGLGLLDWDMSDIKDADDLHQVAFTSKQGWFGGITDFFSGEDFSNFQFKITMVGGTKLTKLSTGAVLTPKSVEHLVEISGWVYDAPENHLELRMIVGSASAMGSASAAGKVDAGEGFQRLISSGDLLEEQVWMDLAETAMVSGSAGGSAQSQAVDIETLKFSDANGVIASASADGKVDGDIKVGVKDSLGNDVISGMLTGVASGDAKADLSLIRVAFPAGATKITWDPIVGSGKPPNYYETSAATSSSFSVAILGVSLLFAWFQL